MWRQNFFPANDVSDQSNFDEEEFLFHDSQRCVSLDGFSKKEEPNLALEFDLLSGLSSEDEVEMLVFNEDNIDGEKNNDENDYVHSVSGAYWPKIHEKLTSNVKERPINKLQEARTDKEFVGHESARHSMADLLDGLQEKNSGLYAIPTRIRRKGRGKKVGVIKKASVIEKGIATVEDPCEIIDSGTSSDDESEDQNVVLTTPQAKKKTMADQFQEALGATSVNEGSLVLLPKQSRACSGGLVENLQRVIQREKEHDLDFTQNLQSETLGDEAGYIDVKILSRLFEAKLTVCLCSIHCYKKSSVSIEKPEEEKVMHKTRTIIFSSRTCVNVELDAGTCVRVWSPWKEVQVLGGNIIILASYFTQTLA